MTSYGLIFKLTLGLWALSLFDVIPSGTALAFTVSFVLMDFMGLFKQDKAHIAQKLQQLNEEEDDGLNERQRDFRRKMAEAKEKKGAPVVMHMTDEEGNESSLTIDANGNVDVQGNVDPKIVRAAYNLSEGVKLLGPEAIAEEFERQINKIMKEQENESKD